MQKKPFHDLLIDFSSDNEAEYMLLKTRIETVINESIKILKKYNSQKTYCQLIKIDDEKALSFLVHGTRIHLAIYDNFQKTLSRKCTLKEISKISNESLTRITTKIENSMKTNIIPSKSHLTALWELEWNWILKAEQLENIEEHFIHEQHMTDNIYQFMSKAYELQYELYGTIVKYYPFGQGLAHHFLDIKQNPMTLL